MELVQGTIIVMLKTLPNLVLGLVFLLIGKLIFDWTTPYKINEELTEKDNPAFGVCFQGYLVGLAFAIIGALQISTGDLGKFFEELPIITMCCGILVILMRISVWINDKLVLYKFSITKEMIDDRNEGTGYVVGGQCVATGLMLWGVMSGESASFGLTVRDIFIYWAIGQAILTVGGLVFQLTTGYDVYDTIENQNNAAAGLSFGAFFIGLGIITRAALIGATSDLATEIPVIIVVAVMGYVILTITRFAVDKILLPGGNLSYEVGTQKNVAAARIAAAGFIGVALFIHVLVDNSALFQNIE